MGSVTQRSLINIVASWCEEHTGEIQAGLSVKSAGELLEYERRLLRCVLQLAALIMAWVLKSVIENKEFQSETGRHAKKESTKKLRFVSCATTQIRTLFGNIVSVTTRYYAPHKKRRGRKRARGRRGKNGAGLYPALERLGILGGLTPALASEVAREVTDGPSMNAVRERFKRLGIDLHIQVVKRISETFAAAALAARTEWVEKVKEGCAGIVSQVESLAGKRVLIGVDGGRLRVRENRCGRLPKDRTMHRYDAPWREPKMLTISTMDDKGRRTDDIPPIYDGTLGNADILFALLHAHLESRGIADAECIVLAGDGAPWIWDRVDGLLRELGVDSKKVEKVIDFYHAVQKLAEVADERKGWSARERRRWLKRQKRNLKLGNVQGVIAALGGLARGCNAKQVVQVKEYFERYSSMMDYRRLAEAGLPIGSGMVESAIRRVVNLRLKGTGMFWIEDNAEGFLHLRCYLKAGRWNVIENAVVGGHGLVV